MRTRSSRSPWPRPSSGSTRPPPPSTATSASRPAPATSSWPPTCTRTATRSPTRCRPWWWPSSSATPSPTATPDPAGRSGSEGLVAADVEEHTDRVVGVGHELVVGEPGDLVAVALGEVVPGFVAFEVGFPGVPETAVDLDDATPAGDELIDPLGRFGPPRQRGLGLVRRETRVVQHRLQRP